MLPRERVFESLQFREPDRVPLYLWVFNQPGVIDEIVARFGSFEAFCDFLELDMTQAFPAKGPLKRRPKPNSDEAIYDATTVGFTNLRLPLKRNSMTLTTQRFTNQSAERLSTTRSEGDGRSSFKLSASLKRRTISSAWNKIWSLWLSNRNFAANFTNELPVGQHGMPKTALTLVLMSSTFPTTGV